MRIIGGRHRGTRLAAPPPGDLSIRPTTDRVREALFNRLAHHPEAPLQDASVLDLFAGTGALGLEALSRGAATATFVENATRPAALIAANIVRLRLGDRATLLRRDATRLGPNPGPPATLAFLDPPYGRRLGEAALAAALAGGWLAPCAFIVWEESAPIAPPPGLTLIDARRYGDTMISLLRHDGTA
jgi:16S rRNA (guanine966-N2)-methyltransferase